MFGLMPHPEDHIVAEQHPLVTAASAACWACRCLSTAHATQKPISVAAAIENARQVREFKDAPQLPSTDEEFSPPRQPRP